MMKYAFVTISLLIIAACTNVTAYQMAFPENEAATKRHIVDFEFKDIGHGTGPVVITMKDGEVLRGQFRETFYEDLPPGPDMTATGSNTDIITIVPRPLNAQTITAHKNAGRTVLHGDQGTKMTCEYGRNTPKSERRAYCETNRGEAYSIRF